MVLTPKQRVLFARTLGRKAKKVFVAFMVLGLFTSVYSITRMNAQPAYAATAATVNFQARLLSSSGNLVPDGNYHIEFKLYTASSGGSAEWTETRTTGNLVQVKNGYLSANLGSVTSFPGTIDWDQDHWITLNIGGAGGSASWDGEMTPRIKLTGVPYAFRAGQLANRTDGSNGTVVDFATPSGNNTITLPALTGTVALLQNAQTFTGAMTFGSAGTGLTVTNNATVSGDLAVNGGDLTASSTLGITVSGAGNDLVFTSADQFRFTGFNCTTYANGGALTTDASGNVSCSDDNGGSGGTGVTLQGSTPGTPDTGNFNITGTGITGTALLTPSLDTPTAVALNIGASNATAITLNQNTTVSAGKTLTVTSGATNLTGATSGDALTVNNSTSTGNIFVAQDNGSAVFTIADGGNVGIRTSTPTASLDVLGDSATISGTGTIGTTTSVVTGTGTAFTTQLRTGDVIIAAGQTKTVGVISSDTQFSLANGENWSPTLSSGTSFTIRRATARIVNAGNQQALALQMASGQTINPFSIYDSTGAYIFTLNTSGSVIATSYQANNGTFSGRGGIAAVFTSGAAGDTTTLRSANATSASSGSVTVSSGTATGGGNVTGNTTVDVGAGSGGATNGLVNIGTTNATSVNIGKSGSNTIVNGLLGVNTSSPQSQFEVKAPTGTSSGAITMTASSGASTFTTSSSLTLNRGDWIVPTTTTAQAVAVTSTVTGTSFNTGQAFTANVTTETFTIYHPTTNFTDSSGSTQFMVQGNGSVSIGGSFSGSVGAGANKLSVAGSVGVSGNVYGTIFGNWNAVNNSQLNLGNSGAIITRNIADANVALTVSQLNGSSTGNIAEFKNSGGTVASISSTGSLSLQNSVDSISALTTKNSNGNALVVVSTAQQQLQIGTTSSFDTTPTKLSDPSSMPAGASTGTAWSPDGQYMTVSHSTSPYITIYKRSGDTFTKLSDPATLPAGTGQGTTWSPDGVYMSVSHSTTPFITIYKRSGDTFTKLANPTNLPASIGTGSAWSPDGQYMTVSHYTYPYITIYKRSGDTFTKLSDPATLPTGTGLNTAWSPDGQYMSVAFNASPYLIIYKRSGDTFTKLSDPATLPAGVAYGAVWSPDGQYMSVPHATSPFVTIYKRAGETYTKLSDPATLPTDTGRGVAWSPDGQYMSVGHNTSRFITIYKRSGDTFTKLSDPATLPTDTGRGVAWSPDGQYMSVASNSSPYVIIYKGTAGQRVNTIAEGNLSVNGTTSVSGLLQAASVSVNNGTLSVSGDLTVTSAGNVAFQKGTDFSTTGTSNDVNFGTGALFRLTGASAQTITGIAGGTDGRIITLMNAGTTTATISNNSGSSSASNRIITGTGSDLSLAAGASINLSYDITASLWRVVGGVAGGPGTCPTCANQQLSNLSGTIAINASLTPNGDNTLDLGSSSYSWRTLYADTSVLTPTVDTAAAGTLTLGGTNATAISLADDTTLADGKYLRITGDATAGRPVTPGEGALFYDTTTKRVLEYANGKWQADRTDAVLVAASNSSQADKDAADYVADGNTGSAGDGDQVQINSALTAGSGKKVILLAGTYTADATILVPNNTTLAGVGQGTVVQLADIDATDNLIENSDTATGTGVVIQDMKLDGQDTANTAGTQYGIYWNNMGDYSTSRTGSVTRNLRIENFRSAGVFYWSSDGNILDSSTVYGMDTGGATLGVYYDNASRNNMITHSVFTTNSYAIRADGSGSTNNSFTNNAFRSNSYGINLYAAINSTISGNNFDNTTNHSVDLYNDTAVSTYNIVTGNSFRGTGVAVAIYNTSDNEVSNNKVHDSGSTTNNNAFQIDVDSDRNSITGNHITDSSASVNNYAITITSANAGSNYLADNTLGGSSINDSGTGTIYGGQNNGTSYLLQPNDDFALTGNAASTVSTTAGNLTLQAGSGTVTLGTSTSLTATGALTITSGGANALGLDAGGAAAINIGATNATSIVLGRAGAGTIRVGQNGGTVQIDGTNFDVSTVGVVTLAGGQTADIITGGATALTLDTGGAAAINIGTTNATQINLNKNVVVAASQSLTLTGGNTASRPASPTEGMLYFDTTTHQLLQYNGTKWVADKTDAVIVAASNSSQADKDAANYVADGNTGAANDGDQVQINNALTAASGKKVVLLAGTYVVDASISVPNNTTLAGIGRGTLVELADLDVDAYIIRNTDTTTGTNVVIRDMKLDGRADLNNSGMQYGIYFTNMGSGTRDGSAVHDVMFEDFDGPAISMEGSQNNIIEGNEIQNSTYAVDLYSGSEKNTITGNSIHGGAHGVSLTAGSHSNTVTANSVYDNGTDGIYVDASNYIAITGNTFIGNGGDVIGINASSYASITGNVVNVGGNAIALTTATYTTISGNQLSGSSAYGISLATSSDSNTITGNNIRDIGGATTNNGIYLSASDSNSITSNTITDSSASSNNYAINIFNSTSDTNYLADNTLGDGSVHDLGTGTIYGGQNNGTSYLLQPNDDFALTGNAASTVSTTAGNLTLQAGSGTVTLGTSTALTATGALTIQSGGANALSLDTGGAAALNIGNANATTINVGTNAVAHAINIGTGAAVQTLTIGSTTAGSTTVIQSNSAALTMSNNNVDFTTTLAAGGPGFNVSTTSTSASALQTGNRMTMTINPGGSTSAAYLGNVFVTTPGVAGTTFNSDIIGAIGDVVWTGASNTNASGRTIGIVGKIQSDATAGAIQNGYGVYSEFQIASTMTNAYGVYASNATGGTITNQYGLYAANLTTATNNYPLYLASATSNQPLLSVNNSGQVVMQNSVDSTTALTVKNSNSNALLVVSTAQQQLQIGTASSFDSTPTKLSDPASLPAGDGAETAWSPDGVYMSVAHSTSPYITIYKRSGDTFTKLSDPASLPAGTGNSVSWSPDGVYMSVGHITSPYITIYKRSGDTFTKLSDPASLPAGAVYGISWSSDGVYMSTAHNTSPYVTIYKRSGDTFTKLSDPASLPTGAGNGIAWSPDNQYLTVAQSGTPWINIYKRSGDTFTKLSDPATLPTGGSKAYGIAWSPNGQYLSITHVNSPYVTIYKRSGDTFTKLSDPASLPAGIGNSTAWSPDSQYMSVSHNTSPYITIYKRSGDTFTKLSDPSSLPTGTGSGTAWSPDGQYMSVAHTTSPYVTIYKGTAGQRVNTVAEGSLSVNGGTSVTGLVQATAGGVFGESLTVRSADHAVLTLEADSDNDGSETGAPYIKFLQDGGSITGSIGYIQTASTLPDGSAATGTGSNNLVIAQQSTADGIDFVTNGDRRLRIGSTGEISIDATTQFTQRLCHSGANAAAQDNVNIGDCAAAGQADLAEMYETVGVTEPGDVVVTKGAYSVGRSDSPYQSAAIGIVSTNPTADGIIGYNVTATNRQPVALAGRVPVKISLENGPINKGDYLTASSTPGFAMKATATGRVIGVALEDYDGSQARVSSLVVAEEVARDTAHAGELTSYRSDPADWPADTGKIMVFVNPTYYVPSTSSVLQGTDLSITGNAIINANATVGANLNVSGHTTLSGGLTVIGNSSVQGNLTVAGDVTTANITVNGHIITGGNAPQVTAGIAAGIEDLMNNIAAPAVTIEGNDTSGTITIVAGTNTAADELAKLTFNAPFAGKPRVVLTPANRDSAKLGAYYDASATSQNSFSIMSDNAPEIGKTYVFTYLVVQ